MVYLRARRFRTFLIPFLRAKRWNCMNTHTFIPLHLNKTSKKEKGYPPSIPASSFVINVRCKRIKYFPPSPMVYL